MRHIKPNNKQQKPKTKPKTKTKKQKTKTTVNALQPAVVNIAGVLVEPFILFVATRTVFAVRPCIVHVGTLARCIRRTGNVQ